MIKVEFIEMLVGKYEPWHRCTEAPAIGDQVDILPEGKTDTDDEVVATVERRQWADGGRVCVCYVSTR